MNELTKREKALCNVRGILEAAMVRMYVVVDSVTDALLEGASDEEVGAILREAGCDDDVVKRIIDTAREMALVAEAEAVSEAAVMGSAALPVGSPK